MITMAPKFGFLQPGDCLLYGSAGTFIDWCIQTKTGGVHTHVEIWEGNGNSVASRNGIGVNRYPFRAAQLITVRRPLQPFDQQLATKYFLSVFGEGYDWIGLSSFWGIVTEDMPHRLFCSSFATAYYRNGNIDIFNKFVDQVKISPWDLNKTPALTTIWTAI